MASKTMSAVAKKMPLLRQLPLLATLKDEELHDLALQTTCTITRAGKTIFDEGEVLDTGYFVASGIVALFKKLPEDLPRIAVELALQGDPIGLIAGLQGVPAPLSAEALRECVLVSFPLELFRTFTEQQLQLKNSLLELTAIRFRSMQARLATLLSRSADMKVVAAIQFIAERLNPTETFPCTVDLARREIALFSGVRTETVIRVTKKLQAEGYISFPHRKAIKLERSLTQFRHSTPANSKISASS